MRNRPVLREHKNERGQTILLVALALVSLLGMAALAIDVVTLYVARSEIQRTADAMALAAAKAVADSGFTTIPTSDPHYIDGTAQFQAQNMAITAVNALYTANPPVNLVAGQPPVYGAPPSVDFTTHPGSFQVVVNLRSASLPTFFSKIWGRGSAIVTATAAAEAYNPANLPNMTPISIRSVKPWLVANADPGNGGIPFINPLTGAVGNNVIGEIFDLVSDCSGLSTPCVLIDPIPGNPAGATTPQVEYLPALVNPNPKNVCPASCGGGSVFEASIECADVNPYSYLSCGGGSSNAQWDSSVNPGGLPGDSASGAECLIHATTTGIAGQDLLTEPLPVFSNPMLIKSQSGLQSGHFVTTSNSVVTIPIIKTTGIPATTGPVTVVGFLQAFVNQVDPTPGGSGPPPGGSINVTVLNIAGCSTLNNSAPPVVGGAGTSPIPVRLITPP